MIGRHVLDDGSVVKKVLSITAPALDSLQRCLSPYFRDCDL